MSRRVGSARVNRRPPSFAATLVALAIVFALAWMFFLRSGPATTAPVVTGIEGTYTWRPSSGHVGQDGAFSAVAGGNAGGRAALPEGETVFSYHPPQSAYDAATRTETTFGGSGGRIAALTHTVGAWPPVWRLATHSPLDYQGLAAVVLTAVEDGDEGVGIKPIKDGDRATWRAAMTMGGKLIDVVVDQQTGIVTWYSDGEDTFTAKVDWDAPPPAGTTYTVDVPAGTEAETVGSTEAYEKSPAAAGRTAGYAPLVSDLAPDGYKLKAVATVADGTQVFAWTGHPTEAGPISPPREPVIGQLYTRGLSWFTLEQLGPKVTRSYGSGLKDWPATSSDERLSLQQTTLQYGALKGATAFTWYQESGPSLFASGARRAVFVTGALTRQELIAFAEGLKPVPANAGR
jgi:hypothetical protein